MLNLSSLHTIQCVTLVSGTQLSLFGGEVGSPSWMGAMVEGAILPVIETASDTVDNEDLRDDDVTRGDWPRGERPRDTL